jgi:hypothetical protein
MNGDAILYGISLWGAPRIHGELLKLGFEARPMRRSMLGPGIPWMLLVKR